MCKGARKTRALFEHGQDISPSQWVTSTTPFTYPCFFLKAFLLGLQGIRNVLATARSLLELTLMFGNRTMPRSGISNASERRLWRLEGTRITQKLD